MPLILENVSATLQSSMSPFSAYPSLTCYPPLPPFSQILQNKLTPLPSYEVIFQDCAGCLATAQYLANLAHRPKHPASDFFNTTSGLVAQLTNAYENFCNTNPADAPVELEHFLCESRDITARFGGPIAVSLSSSLSLPPNFKR